MERPRLERMIYPAELGRYTGNLKRTAIEELIKQKRFPAPIRLSERRKAWKEEDIIAWQQKIFAAARKQDAE
jgi:predicted DNA-binding transcriptional regulator AlpA